MGSLAAVLFRSHATDPDVARRMLAAAPHRGQRAEVCAHGNAVLAVSDHEDRPEGDIATSGAMAAAFTGSLDNGEQLCAELARLGLAPPASTPAAVVLAAFGAWGAGAPNRLRGVFACAISDGTRMWCFRDHLGFRTLFFRDDARALYAASEAKQVIAGAGIARRPNLEVLEKIFYSELLDASPCALEGVERLPKATLMTAAPDRARTHIYWRPQDLLESAHISPGEVKPRFDELFTQAVGRALTGNDVVSLSGGIDSPPLVAYGRAQHVAMSGRPLAALATVYPGQPSVDESRYVAIVASDLDIPLHTYERTARPLDDLDRWVRLLDGPLPKILVRDAEEHYRRARSLGFTSMLTGEVAEFVFDRGRPYVVPHLLVRGRMQALWRHARTQASSGVSPLNIAKQVASAFVPRQAIAAYRRARLPLGAAAVPEWLDHARFKGKYARATVATRRRWSQDQLWAFQGPGLTMEADQTVQELCGLRVRRPWADVDLWEFFLRLPAELKFPRPGRKETMRGLLRGRVPDVILDRQDKTDFEASIVARIDYEALGRWLNDPVIRLPGVRYDLLSERLRRRDLGANDYMWAKDLAAVNAFLEVESA